MGDPLEVASAFHRELDAAKKVGQVSDHVNQVRYARPGVANRIGLGASDNARRAKLGIKTPSAGQVAKSQGNHLAPVEFGKAWETNASKLEGSAFKLRHARFGNRTLKSETGAASGKDTRKQGKPVGGYDPTSYERRGGTHDQAPPGPRTVANRNKAGKPGVMGRDLHFRAVHKPDFKSSNPRQNRYYDIDPGWRGTTS